MRLENVGKRSMMVSGLGMTTIASAPPRGRPEPKAGRRLPSGAQVVVKLG